MSTFIPLASNTADALGKRSGSSHAGRPEDGRTGKADAACHAGPASSALSAVISAMTSAPGVQASFSPQSLRALEDSASHISDIASNVKDLVQVTGHAGAELLGSVAGAIDSVGAAGSHLLTSGADAVVKSVGAVRSGVKEVSTAVGSTVSHTAGHAGAALESAVESAVGYAALAALAGGALINVQA